MIALRCPVCGNLVDAAIDGGCTKRCDDIFHGKEELMTTDPKAPLPDDLALERYGLEWNGPDTFVAQPMPDGYWTPWHIASARIAALQADKKRLREALAPFSAAAAKYQDIGKSPVADYIKKKTGLIAGYGTVFIKLCSDSTSPKNWFDAAEAIAQADGKAGE